MYWKHAMRHRMKEKGGLKKWSKYLKIVWDCRNTKESGEDRESNGFENKVNKQWDQQLKKGTREAKSK